jgi:hypothetical protein
MNCATGRERKERRKMVENIGLAKREYQLRNSGAEVLLCNWSALMAVIFVFPRSLPSNQY